MYRRSQSATDTTEARAAIALACKRMDPSSVMVLSDGSLELRHGARERLAAALAPHWGQSQATVSNALQRVLTGKRPFQAAMRERLKNFTESA